MQRQLHRFATSYDQFRLARLPAKMIQDGGFFLVGEKGGGKTGRRQRCGWVAAAQRVFFMPPFATQSKDKYRAAMPNSRKALALGQII